MMSSVSTLGISPSYQLYFIVLWSSQGLHFYSWGPQDEYIWCIWFGSRPHTKHITVLSSYKCTHVCDFSRGTTRFYSMSEFQIHAWLRPMTTHGSQRGYKYYDVCVAKAVFPARVILIATNVWLKTTLMHLALKLLLLICVSLNKPPAFVKIRNGPGRNRPKVKSSGK